MDIFFKELHTVQTTINQKVATINQLQALARIIIVERAMMDIHVSAI